MINVNMNISEVFWAYEELLDDKNRFQSMKAIKRAGANIIRKEAYKRAPVWKPKGPHRQQYRQHKTGKYYGGSLKQTLKTAKTGLAVTRRGNVFIVGGGVRHYVPYAHLVEFGHEGPHPAPPHPFMEPAAIAAKDAARSAAVKKFITEVQRRLEVGKARSAGGRRKPRRR